MELLHKSKVPNLETTIFTVMSALADKYSFESFPGLP